MNSLSKENNNNIFLYLLLPYLLLVIVHIFLSTPMEVPIIWPDEFAYLFFAKYMAGYENIQQIPRIELTGSFGYSVILAPIFLLFKDPATAYSWILILNSVIGSTLYIALFVLLKQLFDVGNNRAFWISFVVSLYPAYLLQTDVALTDAVTPAFFVFGIVIFNKFVHDKSLLIGIIFALVAGYLNWIHIRMLPFTMVAIFFLSALVYYKRMPIFQTGLSIVLMVIMILLGVIIGDHLTFAISGTVEKSQRITTSLIQVAEVLLIFVLLIITFYFLLRKHYLLMFFTSLGLFGGVLASTSFSTLWVIPVVGVALLIILLISSNITYKQAFTSFLLLNFVSFFTYFVLPDFGYYTIVAERIMIWFVNASGSIFYAMFSTYGLFLAGLIFILRQVWNDALVEVPAVKHTDMFKEVKKFVFSGTKLLNNPNSLTLLFMVGAAFLMIFITIFPSKLSVSHYRADHLFYGRYVEVILAGFIAIGIFKLITSEAKEFIISALSTWVWFVILTFLMIITYDNVIPSELSFRSVLSFFPLRAVLGNINIMLFFIASLIVSIVIFITFRYKSRIGKIILAIAFLSFSAFTYIYVNYYHQIEKKQRNVLVNYIQEYFPENQKISYDRKIFSEKSQNGLSYVWLMPSRKFDFFSSGNEQSNSDLIIAGSDYGIKSKAILLNIEHDGYDHLWLKFDTLNAKHFAMMPSYFDIPLNKPYVAGVVRNGFHEEKWINGKVEISNFVSNPDSIFKVELEIVSSNPNPHNLIVWLDDKELFNQNIQQGAWRYTLNIKSERLLDKLNFKFFSDLTRDKSNNNRLNGILINSLIVRKNDLTKNLSDNINNLVNSTSAELTIYPRRNIDLSQLDLSAGDSIRLPIIIKNKGDKAVKFGLESSVHISYTWKDFVFKNKIDLANEEILLNGLINPDEEFETFIVIKAPQKAEKYFFELNILSKKQVIINQIDKRETIINLKL